MGGHATQHRVVRTTRPPLASQRQQQQRHPFHSSTGAVRCPRRGGSCHVWTARDDWTAGTSMSDLGLGAGAGAIAPVCACMHARGLAAHSAAASQSARAPVHRFAEGRVMRRSADGDAAPSTSQLGRRLCRLVCPIPHACAFTFSFLERRDSIAIRREEPDSCWMPTLVSVYGRSAEVIQQSRRW